MQYIIPHLKVNSHTGYNCLFTSMKNISSYYNCNLSETDIYFLCDGIDVWFESDLNNFGYKDVSNIIRNLGKSTAINSYLNSKNDDNEFLEKSYKAIMDNKIVLLMVGTAKLSYHKVYKENENRGHTILMYGFDSEKDIAYIGDAHIRDYSGKIFTFQGAIPMSEVMESTFLYGWFDFTNRKAIAENAIINQVIKNLEKFLKDYSFQGNYFGNFAIKKYLERLDSLVNLDSDNFSKTCTNIYYNIKILTILPIIEFMASFINEHKALQISGYEDILKSLNYLYNEWSKFAIMFLKIGKTRKKERIGSVLINRQNIISIQVQVLNEYLEFIKKAIGGVI